MIYIIWHSAKNGVYNYGTEADLQIHEALTGENFTILYEMEASQLFLVKKIVSQLNYARKEQEHHNLAVK